MFALHRTLRETCVFCFYTLSPHSLEDRDACRVVITEMMAQRATADQALFWLRDSTCPSGTRNALGLLQQNGLVKCVQGDAAQGDSAWQMTAAAPHSIVECLTLGPLSAAISTRAGLSSALQTHWELMSSLSQKHGWERIITDVTDHRLRTFAEYNPTKGPKLYYINLQQPLRPHYLQALLNGTLTVPHGYPDYYYKDLLSGRISCLA